MSRILAVVERSIKVHIHDVAPGDVLYFSGEESDAIISRVERDGEFVKFHYVPRMDPDGRPPIMESMWMNPDLGEHLFIHDLKNERAEFLASQEREE